MTRETDSPNALAYARARVSLLGPSEHMDTVNRALDALDGLPGAALLGGWTFKGFTAWAQRLEEEIAMLKACIDSSPSLDEWNVLRATQRPLTQPEHDEIERLRAFRDFFTERCEMLFFHYGMEPVELFNKCALTPNV